MDFIEKYMVCGGVCVVGDMCVSVCIKLYAMCCFNLKSVKRDDEWSTFIRG